jgi:glycosyltransferase involved in cell wall biosynthesis
MRFLFITSGYPDVVGTGSGSGIGAYVREMSLGLVHRGHECHALVWADSRTSTCGDVVRVADGITVHMLPHSYWPVVERLAPDSRDVHNLRMTVRKLDAKWNFDWIEIQSEEGIAIGIQKDFPAKTILRIHTTLSLMIRHKDVKKTFTVRRRLTREKRSLQMARRITVPSQYHRAQLQSTYPFIAPIFALSNGLNLPSPGQIHGMFPDCGQRTEESRPTFIIVGTPDRRKGFDRIEPILSCYARKHGACTAVIVSSCSDEKKREFGLLASGRDDVSIVWLKNITAEELLKEYSRASALLHVARYESFGLPLIEAAAFETPVVATRTGIADELLDGELAQFIVDGDDPEMCADALCAAVAGRSDVGKRLRAKYLQYFTREKMVDVYLNSALPVMGEHDRG